MIDHVCLVIHLFCFLKVQTLCVFAWVRTHSPVRHLNQMRFARLRDERLTTPFCPCHYAQRSLPLTLGFKSCLLFFIKHSRTLVQHDCTISIALFRRISRASGMDILPSKRRKLSVRHSLPPAMRAQCTMCSIACLIHAMVHPYIPITRQPTKPVDNTK